MTRDQYLLDMIASLNLALAEARSQVDTLKAENEALKKTIKERDVLS